MQNAGTIRMNNRLLCCSTTVLILGMLSVSMAQKPDSLASGRCLFCKPMIRPALNHFFFQSPCPEVLPSSAGGRLSYLNLSTVSVPGHERPYGPLLRPYYDYLCNSKKSHEALFQHYLQVMSGMYKQIPLPADTTGNAVRSTMLNSPLRRLYSPYDHFKSDFALLQDNNDWAGIGASALWLVYEIWVRN